MSEYQYYEFVAVDRPLTPVQQGEVRALSTRARITASSFVNTYEWGDFKGDQRQLMERYFDAHLYLANWGTRQLMLRLPKRVLDRSKFLTGGPGYVSYYDLLPDDEIESSEIGPHEGRQRHTRPGAGWSG